MRWILTTGRYAYLTLVILLTAFFGYSAAHVEVDQSNDSMNARDAEHLGAYAELKRLFGSDEDMLLSVTSSRLLEEDGLRLIERLTRRIEALDGVRRVHGLTNARQLVAGPDGAEDVPLVPRPFTDPQTGARVRAALARNPHLTGLLISADRRTSGILVAIEDREGDDHYRYALIDAVRQLMIEEGTGDIELHLTGISVQKHDVTRFLQRDQAVLIPLSILVLAAVLALFFRRLSGLTLPLMVTGVSLVWTVGCYALAGLKLNPITSLLPPVIMVLSITTSVHLYHGWLRGSSGLNGRLEYLAHVVRRLRNPCFFAALTTAFGFLSLAVSDTPAVRYFGLFAALGVMLSFGIAMTLVPVGLSFLPAPTPQSDSRPNLLGMFLEQVARMCTRHPVAILGIAASLSLLAVGGIPRIRNNTDLVRFLKPSAPLYQDTMFIDQKLTGPNTLDLMLARTDGRPLTGPRDIERLAAFVEAAREYESVTGVTSIVPLLEQIHRAETGGTALVVPTDAGDLAYYFDLLEASDQQGLLREVIDPTFARTRIRVSVHAIGTAAAARLVTALVGRGKQIFGPSYSLVPTGAFYQVAADSNRLVRTQVKSFALAFLLVIVALGVLFRSVELMLVSLTPNFLPILWTAGLMGYWGIELSSGTTMIAAAVLGIAVDDTIHYLARFGRVRRADTSTAIMSTTTATGGALVISSLVLSLGFWVGCFGSFRPTIHFSLLTGATMLTALACDLFVLPACLMVSRRVTRRLEITAGAAVLFLIVAAVPNPQPAVADTTATAPLDAATARIVRRGPVPPDGKPRGEARLVQRPDAIVLQVILHTKLLKRVVGRIRSKERASWPADRDGHESSTRYVAALEDAVRQVRERRARHDTPGDRSQSLLIELVLTETTATVVISDVELTAAPPASRMVVKEQLALLVLPRTYVERNMRLIAADSFQLSDAEAEELLAVRPWAESGVPPCSQEGGPPDD